MNTNRKGYDDDYIMDDGMEYEDSSTYEESEDEAFSDVIKRGWFVVKDKFGRMFSKKKYDDLDDEADEADAEDTEYEERRKPRRNKKAAQQADKTDSYSQKKRTSRSYVNTEPSDEDLENFDKKYGTFGSSAKAKQNRMNKEKFGVYTTNSRRKADNVTKVQQWDNYKGNVKNILEVEPKNMDEVKEIANKMQEDYAVIINVKGMRDMRENVLDFLDGAAYVLNYTMDGISDSYYICVPKGYMRKYELGRKYGSNV